MDTTQAPQAGQVVKYRRRDRAAYIRLEETARVHSDPRWLTLYGYPCKKTGLPTRIRPVARVVPVSEIEVIAL